VTAFANVDGNTVLEATLIVPNVGPWYADVVFEGAPDVSGSVMLAIGTLRLVGVVDVRNDGVFGEQRRSRIVGGAGGWATLVPPLHYHNDAGVRALSVAQDAARLAGETLGSFNPPNAAIGADYVRQAGLAARVLEDVIGGAPWHVDFDGRTNVGERSSSEADVEAYEVLEVDPRETLATLAVDDLSSVGIGSILTRAPLVAPLTVHELEVTVGADRLRVKAWGGATAAGGTATSAPRSLTSRGRIAESLNAIARRSLDGRLFGRYRYRVVRMSGDNVELQAVVVGLGLPDVLPVAMKPGVAGAHAKLIGGAIVLVEFIEGDRTLPIVSAFSGKSEEGAAPEELDLSITTTLRLGGASASEGVTLGDSHKSWADGHAHAYIDSIGTAGTPTPKLTTAPALAPGPPPTGLPITPDPSPSPSSKVKVVS